MKEIKGDSRFKFPSQEAYYKNIVDFLNNPNADILIANGGMGLGKTRAILYALNEQENINRILVVTPHSKIKRVWSKELLQIDKNCSQIIWENKRKCCRKLEENSSFDIINNCNDSCSYQEKLIENKIPTELFEKTYSSLKYPKQISEFNKEHPKLCYLPFVRFGLLNEKYIFGDYYAFLNKKMTSILTEINRPKSCLVIDEGEQLLPRSKKYFSKEFSLTNGLKKINEELHKNYFLKYENVSRQNEYLSFFKIIKKVERELIKIAKKEDKKIDRYTYNSFIEFLDKNKVSEIYLLEILDKIKEDIRLIYSLPNYEDDKEDPALIRFVRYVYLWKTRAENEGYDTYFQYSFYENKQNKKKSIDKITLKLACRDVGKELEPLLSDWDKIILLGGTLPNTETEKKLFREDLGITNLNVIWPDRIDSYPITPHIINYCNNKDSFKLKYRKETIQRNIKDIIETLNFLDGRTLLFTQSYETSSYLLGLLHGKITKKIVNFTGKQKLDEEKEKVFNSSTNIVGIKNIWSSIAGLNYDPQNISIFGIPFRNTRNVEFEDERDFLARKYNWTPDIARKQILKKEINNLLLQAVYRGKRKEEDKPIIILWGRNYNYEYEFGINLREELKGMRIYTITTLKDILRSKNDKRRIQNNS